MDADGNRSNTQNDGEKQDGHKAARFFPAVRKHRCLAAVPEIFLGKPHYFIRNAALRNSVYYREHFPAYLKKLRHIAGIGLSYCDTAHILNSLSPFSRHISIIFSVETPFNSAIFAAVYFIMPLWDFSPRCGAGAIYGQSVSSRSLSIGTASHAAHAFFEFLNVSTPVNPTYMPSLTTSSAISGL